MPLKSFLPRNVALWLKFFIILIQKEAGQHYDSLYQSLQQKQPQLHLYYLAFFCCYCEFYEGK